MCKKPGLKKTVLGTAAIIVLSVLSGCLFFTSSGEMITPELRVLGLPQSSAVSSINLRITGEGMTPVEVEYSSLPSVINIAVPEGNDRSFELSVSLYDTYIASSSDIAVSYRGVSTVDINSDSAVVTLNMGILDTKIVIPDAYNYRVVQIVDMTGTGWSTVKWSDLGFTNDYEFFPYDVDTDQNGTVYIANGRNDGVHGGIYTIDSFDFTSSSAIAPAFLQI